ncbi:sensor histidine kinase [Flavihumibacter petaseus]|uniref:histidine kinase n=1 Tax=Flavihumibacter petaseus NBRC 106054 TaxID=1220578 RepID=A0A0E9MWU1_9BACT|nr:response regulator [Flavihumibacter petaseus]GAO41585.1 putative two-component hybrid sensor and regulator [Flavihumibacter petaseus NBRC 106054]
MAGVPDISILVVDDREENLLSIEAILENRDYKLVKALSGRAALKILLQEHDFALILMDVQMPEMNGLETASLIYQREKLRHIPIIFITAHEFGDDQRFEGYKMGAVDFIYKPFHPELLRAKVAVFTELFRKNRELQTKEKLLLRSNKQLQAEINERIISENKVKALNKQLLQNNKTLKSINEDLDRFAYVASHDLQEPLRKIRMFSDRLLTYPGMTEDMKAVLGKIMHSSDRMKLFIDDLLRFSQHTNHIDDFAPVDLNTLLQEVVEEFEIDLQKKSATVELVQLPVVWGNGTLLKQVFFNLLGNALKFTEPSRKPQIRLQQEETDEHFVVSVADNGIGFDPAYSEDIFQVFKKLHSYDEFRGNGIGLSICKKIMDYHNGLIKAESRPAQGSTFYLYWPKEKTTAQVQV